jgi:putative ABC transport system permease protein
MLTAVGIYGLLALSVASRRRELAIRSAVGARPRDIRTLVVGEGVRLLAGGIALGILAAFMVSRVIQSFLFEVGATDPWTIGGAALLFTAVTLLACWPPTARAAAVDPLEALRSE